MLKLVLFVAVGTLCLILIAAGGVTWWVQAEAPYRLEALSRGDKGRALVLYHPSRDQHFSEQISLALAEGLKDAGVSVDRATMTRTTPATPQGYGIIFVVSNTFYASPDQPTLNFLRRAKLNGIPTVGVMLGGGDTDRAQHTLQDALQHAGANVVAMQSLWVMRPNDKQRMNEPNRVVAADMAQLLARSHAIQPAK